MRRPSLAVALAGVALVAAGCGVEQPDLFAINRTGNVAGARLSLVVNDAGTVRCNHGKARTLPDPQLLTARELARAIAKDATRHRRFPPGRDGVFSYTVRSPDGSVSWADSSRPLPERYFRLALLTRQIAKGPCKLPR